MKFLKGLIMGSVAGFAAGTAISEQRRQDLLSKARSAKRRAAGVTPTTDAAGMGSPDPVTDRTSNSTAPIPTGPMAGVGSTDNR